MLYIFHGPDDFSRSEKLAELKAALGDPAMSDFNYTLLDGRSVKLGEIQHQASAMPFLCDRRLVVVTAYLTELGRKAKDAQPLLDWLDKLSPTSDLVFVEVDSLDKRHPILKIKAAQVVEFAAPDKKSLPKWILQRVKAHRGQITPDAAEMLGRLVGPHLRKLNNELEKLSLYALNRAITVQDVALLVPYTEEAEDFGLANAIGQRNARHAFDQLHKSLDEGRHPLAILAAIATQMRGLLEVKDMAERGMNAGAIAQSKGWKSDFAAKKRLDEVKNFSMPRLEGTLEALLETDLAIKTGRMDAFLAIDMLIGQLCSGKK